MLGTTFNYVFEAQMENLQFGDRCYYLTRTQGTNFLNNLEPNTFADIVMRNTELGDIYSTHLNGQLFVTPDHIIELDRGIAQTDYNGADRRQRPDLGRLQSGHEAILGPKVVRDYTGSTVRRRQRHDVGGYLRVLGGEHYVLGGTEGDDRIYGDSGIDTLWGDGGNDYLNGMTESDDVFGGDGDDIIEDPFGDDVLRGNEGNDVITARRRRGLAVRQRGPGLHRARPGRGGGLRWHRHRLHPRWRGQRLPDGQRGRRLDRRRRRFRHHRGRELGAVLQLARSSATTCCSARATKRTTTRSRATTSWGRVPACSATKACSASTGASARATSTPACTSTCRFPIFTTIPEDILRDRFDQVEALSGWKYSDILDGDDRGHKGGGSSAPDSVLHPVLFADHLLTQEGIDRIDGFNAWFAGARDTLFGAADADSWSRHRCRSRPIATATS